MKPPSQFQKMRERRIERERLAREFALAAAKADLHLCEANWKAVFSGREPPHLSASNYQGCLKSFSTAAHAPHKLPPNWRAE